MSHIALKGLNLGFTEYQNDESTYYLIRRNKELIFEIRLGRKRLIIFTVKNILSQSIPILINN